MDAARGSEAFGGQDGGWPGSDVGGEDAEQGDGSGAPHTGTPSDSSTTSPTSAGPDGVSARRPRGRSFGGCTAVRT
ncbi:MAG TPA: hypothetical protein VGJ95_18005 [Pseudonocardiaceae bacterium]